MIQTDLKTQINQAGSVATWIFIAIALFAALSFAVSDSMRTSSTSMSEYEIDLTATEIIDYARNIRDTVQELRINGCSDTEISFENNAVSGYVNANAPSDNSCHVFHPNGGGLAYQEPEERWLDTSQSANDFYGEWTATSSFLVVGFGDDGNGLTCDGGSSDGSCKDLLIGVAYLKPIICKAINKKLTWGIDSLGTPFQDYGISYGASLQSRFVGTYGSGYQMGSASPTHYSSIANGCVEGDTNPATNTYHFFQVLIAR